MKFLRCWFIDGHHLVWRRNIYGDEINITNGKRSLWQCVVCGAYRLKGPLFQPPPREDRP